MGKGDSNDSVPQITEPAVVPEPQTSSTWTCHGEFTENGKIIHYLYNPDEKDPTKAWKKSEKCNK